MAYILNDIKLGIQAIAPTIATALGGPLAGTAIKAISTAIFGHPDATTDELNKVLENISPDLALKLKQAEQDFIIENRKLDLQSESLPFDDKKNAREREVDIAKTGHADKTPEYLAYIITAGFFGFLFCLSFLPIQTSMHDVVMILVGTLSTAWVGVVGYYFGTSIGSKQKDAIIYNQSNGTK